MTSRRANLLTAAGLLALMALVPLTAPRWARVLRQPLAALVEEESPAATPLPAAPRTPEAEVQRRISVRLYFEAGDRFGLVPEERSVPFSSDLSGQIRAVVEELIHGSATGLLPPLAPQVKVLEVFVSARGVAYVNLSKEVSAGLQGGSRAELLTVYAVVNSITANFPAIKRVQILVDDRPVPTLAGHVDLSRPLPPDMTFVALPSSPSPSSAASPAPALPVAVGVRS
jgi:Sporulation and spore germination